MTRYFPKGFFDAKKFNYTAWTLDSAAYPDAIPYIKAIDNEFDELISLEANAANKKCVLILDNITIITRDAKPIEKKEEPKKEVKKEETTESKESIKRNIVS